MRRPPACPAMVIFAMPLAGCSDIQSVLAPHGPDAARIALLGLVLFIGALAVMLIVGLALWLAISGPPRWRRRIASDASIRLGGIVFPATVLTLLLGYGLWVMRETIAPAAPPALRIEVTGEQWWWRIAYAGPEGEAIAEANEIRMPIGREAEFVLRSADVIHSFWVPSLGGKLDMIPGRVNRLRLTAERPGIYRGQCAEYCGGPHALMAIEIIAMPQAEFDAWLVAARAPRPEPATETERRGRDLFIAAGCGACHAVRGTAAAGTVGPDLSRVGGRRSLAAATLPSSRENIARFIAHGQEVKPGNLMPSFAIFKPDDLLALSNYLASLK